ncbi:acyl-CoA carboxylase subunit beta [Streptomyces resistomycificus]|uniref:Methylmalonyl-CoA carboxyltransferase n=1 Tax=Streptomyces resistomycificus TaxID=67356 RepID=A0A0L8LX26_9ACTN|nr:acyl-CoA carboxylase subunit beta [Streptomyces resistomycificus]KOG42629.1 methylmalonyl-CoA carboxyltransferase [Streptomyces resistomycificus]KUN92782.1 methylmalonyl-CoA carboxyltransferase [Streptomyces resistomycificus]
MERRRATAVAPGGPRRRGEFGARERIERLLDAGSFTETGQFVRARRTEGAGHRPYGDGVVTGHGTVDGRPVCVFAQDSTVFGGSMGEAFGEKTVALMDLALKTGCPVVGLNDSGGARIQEGVASLALYAELVRRNVQASGVIPQISVVLGPCAGGAAYSPAITDFTVMVDGASHMFVTGPDVIEAVTGERTTAEDLGGARASNTVNGNAHFLAADEGDALDVVRDLLSYLPANNLERPPEYAPGAAPAGDRLDEVVPDRLGQAYDMRDILREVVDDGELLDVQELFAPNIICALARVEGRSVGIVANQPMHAAGVLDIDASEKAARFVRFCDAFGVPLLTFADVPGYLSGVRQEQAGIIRRGAKLLYAYAEATVPKVTVVVRKAYGGGYAVMGSKHLGADVNLAWPTARIAVMGAEGAVGVLHRRELAASDDPEALRARLVAAYESTHGTPYAAAERGYVDAVIAPRETRVQVCRALRALRGKRAPMPQRRHGNIPL